MGVKEYVKEYVHLFLFAIGCWGGVGEVQGVEGIGSRACVCVWRRVGSKRF